MHGDVVEVKPEADCYLFIRFEGGKADGFG
jgi:hypothetical protein